MLKMLLKLLVMLTVICSVTFSFAANSPSVVLLSGNASTLGRADTGVAYRGSDTFCLNPASIAYLEQYAFSFNYGTLMFDFINPSMVVGIPTSYGVFGSSLRYIKGSDTFQAYQLVVGGAKEFTQRFFCGATMSFVYGKGPRTGAYFTGITIGSLYKTKINTKFDRGFGLFYPSIGFSTTAGIPFGKDGKFTNLNHFTIGSTLPFYDRDAIQTSLLADVSYYRFNDTTIKIGCETLLKNSYALRIGYIFSHPFGYDCTLGAGYIIKNKQYEVSLNYALAHHKGTDFVHYIGTQIYYGALDIQPPHVSIKASERYISPNADGIQDFVLFNLSVSDASKLGGWRLQIRNDSGSVVREYRIIEREIEETLTIKRFFEKLLAKRESAVVPSTIFWDGTDEKGNVLPDGNYTYAFMAWDERNNIAPEISGIITIDNTPPNVELTVEDKFFSPNNDGRKDVLKIIQKINTQTNDVWKAAFIDTAGRPVKNYQWTGTDVPKTIIWDGKDDSGNDVPEGLYTYQISCTDYAGNKAIARIHEISLSRKYQTVDVTSPQQYFSYLLHTHIGFTPTITDSKNLVSWTFTITTDKGNPVFTTQGTTLPKMILWDGKSNKGSPLNDGQYYYYLSVEYIDGNIPQSFPKLLIIDSTPPEVSLTFTPRIFSPDGDGENDILTIYPYIKDNVGIKNWQLNIYAPAGYVFKTFKGEEIPSELKWDGIGINNEIVESATDYTLELIATDITGNSTKSKRVKLPIDVLVMVTERGLKIRISNIEFAFDSARLTEQAFPILNRVVEILNKYESYNVIIEGHTDDIGEEQYNLRLSEARAKSVMDYLISKGIAKHRLTSRGMGETSPFLPNTSIENRRRNRRVEFLLIKPNEINEQWQTPKSYQ